MFNLNKINYILLQIFFIIISIALYFSYNVVSNKTHQKNFYLVKDGDPSFFDKINLQSNPIINENTIKEFIKKSTLSIFNYRTAKALENLEKNRNLFDKDAYDFFYLIFEDRIYNEKNLGAVITDTILLNDPLYIGSYNYGSYSSRLYYFQTRELRIGENESRINRTYDVFIEIVPEDFQKNNRGLSIKSINLR